MTIPVNEQKDDITYETRACINEVFFSESEYTKTEVADMLERQVVNADDDTGEWAPDAYAVIYHHGLMPSVDRLEIEEWFKVSKLLPDFFYVEAINPEVSAVYQLQ